MSNGGFAVKNLWRNLTKVQKVGILAGLIIVILLGVLLALLVAEQNNGNETVEEVAAEETYTTDDGNIYTVTTDTVVDENGNEVTVSVKEDEYGNTTTTDPNLITTYFPHQVMREHGNMDPTLRYFLYIDEGEMVIHASIEECDVEGDKELVQRYLSSVPVDLSGYTINYEIFDEDVVCAYEVEDPWE